MHGATIMFQEEALHFEKRKIKLMEERLKKKSKAHKDYMFLMRLLPSIKNTERHTKFGTQNIIYEQRNRENSNF